MNLGIIADGNRRWAKENQLPTKEGHQKGFLAIKDELLPALESDPDFNELTIYAFSTENWKRNPLEVKYLMELYESMMDDWMPELRDRGVRIKHAGRKDRIPKKLRDKIAHAEEQTQHLKDFTIYICLDYGGQDELIRTVNKQTDWTIKALTKNLEVPPLDIVLRTGGENRISNFCLWQSAYAEFFFIDEKLPELTKEKTTTILERFKNRDRRQGS